MTPPTTTKVGNGNLKMLRAVPILASEKLRAKMRQNSLRLGVLHIPREGAYDAPSDPLFAGEGRPQTQRQWPLFAPSNVGRRSTLLQPAA